ncbi:hypothetical protein SH668x_000315 [Planctomicrobium sp. SH668]|uniref:hypothetical protein n=1 Tax=Planctomicrobium sp. SH668 TaxID=3448126 RepID=UPI003F5B4FC4
MPQVESLTVQILGDSSDLQQELTSVADQLDELGTRLTSMSSGFDGLGSTMQSLGNVVGPLQSIGSVVAALNQQIQLLSGHSVTLDVSPALSTLGQLLQAAQMTAAQLAALSMMSLGGGGMPAVGGGPSPLNVSGKLPTRNFASGGAVIGPGGIDQVPARLTAGEYVLNQSAVDALGVDLLNHWNAGRFDAAATTETRLQRVVPTIPPSQTRKMQTGESHTMFRSESAPVQSIANYGGIQIHVQEAGDVSDLMLDLRRQGIGLRHRRG